MPNVTLQVCGKTIEPTDSVRNLGVVFDSSMTMSSHVSNLCSSLKFHIRNISQIRRYLDTQLCHTVVRALVLSRLDYCNSLLLGSMTSDFDHLQRVQNWAAKLICGGRKFDHATPYLRQLHWLPVRERVHFKVLMMAFKCIQGLVPDYLSSCLPLHHSSRTGLRSGSDNTLLKDCPPVNSLIISHRRTFSYAVPHYWNDLPRNIRTSVSLAVFKKILKTRLFPDA